MQTAAFAAAAPIRLSADQLFDSLTRVLGIKEQEPPQQTDGPGMGVYRRAQTGRFQFHQLFGFDPSTCPDEVTGTIPQALFMMNSRFVVERAGGFAKRLLDDAALSEAQRIERAYLMALTRPPDSAEVDSALTYIAELEKKLSQPDAHAIAWRSFCHVLMSTNEFLYLD